MPTIGVSDVVWTYLQRHAEHGDETPSAVLERLLGLEQPQSGRDVLPEGAPRPQSDFREPILNVLIELGGRAPKRDVLARLPQHVALTAADLERNRLGHRRWERRTASAAADMRREGLLSHTRHGIWALARPSNELPR